jgi:hypothetical protein
MSSAGTPREESNRRKELNPVVSMNTVKIATQNQTLTVNSKKFDIPSDEITMLKNPKLLLNNGTPGVMNRTGKEIISAKNGIKVVLTTKSLRGILETKLRVRGIKHINANIAAEGMKSEPTIKVNVAISFVKGFKDCRKPFLLLRSSM